MSFGTVGGTLGGEAWGADRMHGDLWRKGSCSTPPGTSQAPRRARKRAEGGASSNVFSMFDQSQIQEFKEVGWSVRCMEKALGRGGGEARVTLSLWG